MALPPKTGQTPAGLFEPDLMLAICWLVWAGCLSRRIPNGAQGGAFHLSTMVDEGLAFLVLVHCFTRCTSLQASPPLFDLGPKRCLETLSLVRLTFSLASWDWAAFHLFPVHVQWQDFFCFRLWRPMISGLSSWCSSPQINKRFFTGILCTYDTHSTALNLRIQVNPRKQDARHDGKSHCGPANFGDFNWLVAWLMNWLTIQPEPL